MGAVVMLSASASSSSPRGHLPARLWQSISPPPNSSSPQPRNAGLQSSSVSPSVNGSTTSVSRTPSQRQNLQYDGIRETSALVAGLLQSEAEAVGADQVVVEGLEPGLRGGAARPTEFRGPTPFSGFSGDEWVVTVRRDAGPCATGRK
jgi:hypothetical protein